MTLSITSTSDSYVTNPGRSSLVFHALPSIYFYCRVIPTVFRAARLARKKAFDSDEWIKKSLDIISYLEKVDCRFFVDGKKNFISLESPCVFVANHMSTLETFAMAAIVRPHRPLTFVVKDSLVKYPVFKHIMKSRNPIVVSRKSPRDDFRAVMEQGIEKLAAGVSIVVFPQSVRTRSLDPEKFNSIGVKLARKAGAPVVPLALKTDAWSTGWPIKDMGRIRPERFIHFSFGRPIAIEGSGKAEHRQIVDFISAKLARWNTV